MWVVLEPESNPSTDTRSTEWLRVYSKEVSHGSSTGLGSGVPIDPGRIRGPSPIPVGGRSFCPRPVSLPPWGGRDRGSWPGDLVTRCRYVCVCTRHRLDFGR